MSHFDLALPAYNVSYPLVPRTDVRRLLITGFVIIAVGLGSLFAWATLAPLHSAVAASGVLVPITGRKTVRHTEGGVLAEIHVAEGDQVKAGDLLLRLDPTEAQARLDTLIANQHADLALGARLDAELYEQSSITFPSVLMEVAADPAVLKLKENQQHLFALRRAETDKENDLLKQRIAALDTAIATLADQRRFVAHELSYNQQELDTVQHLLLTGNATKPRLLELEKEAARLQAHDQELASQIAQDRQLQVDAAAAAAQRQDDRREKTLVDQQANRVDLAKLDDEMLDAQNRLAKRDIRAPDDGVVVGLGHLAKGGIISPAEPIMDIVPDEAGLIVEVHVAPKDIEALQPGLPAKLTLTAYDTRTVGRLDGTVESVSADRLTDPVTHLPYYLTRISLKDATAHDVHHLRILAGMPVEAHILTRSRTALDYLISPITHAYASAFIQR